MDTSNDVERFADLERRVADLEARSRSPQSGREWSRSLLRWLATTPPLLLVFLVGMDRLSSATALPLGLLLVALWASAVVLWAFVEVLACGDLRFRLTRLILVVAMLAVILGYWQVAVRQPCMAEQSCLASLKGLSPNVHWEPIGPAWLIRLLGEASFRRVYAMELAGPEVDGQQLRHLHALPHLYSLWLTGPRVDDGMIDNLPDLPGLRFICLNQSRVTESGVERLRRARPLVNVFVQ
jgi:hypothetical protein